MYFLGRKPRDSMNMRMIGWSMEEKCIIQQSRYHCEAWMGIEEARKNKKWKMGTGKWKMVTEMRHSRLPLSGNDES